MKRITAELALTAVVAVVVVAAPAHASTTIGGPVVGAAGYYDYSPSEIQGGDIQDHVWCGDSSGHTTDEIFHQQFSFTGGVHVTVPQHTVMVEGPAGTWDSTYVCNPDIVKGAFSNPFGDGANYTYALYYVGTSHAGGVDNSIGVAFGNSPDSWRKYPTPVITPDPGTLGQGLYGVGQPNVSYIGGALTMLYEANETTVSHAEANSTDGVHWTAPHPTVTTGLDDAAATFGGAAYDSQDGRWYAAFNEALRPASTTGGVVERGQPGVTLYASTDPMGTAWARLDTIDSAQTGYEANFLAGILRNTDGTVYTPLLPTVELYASTSMPRPAWNATHADLGNSAGFNQWQIAWSTWTPGAPWRAVVRLAQATGNHEIATGWQDLSHYHNDNVNLGSLAEAPTGEASVPLYSCKAFSADYIPSLDPACAGQNKAGLLGYGYATPAAGRTPLYWCTVPQVGDTLSADPGCEGWQTHGNNPIIYSQS